MYTLMSIWDHLDLVGGTKKFCLNLCNILGKFCPNFYNFVQMSTNFVQISTNLAHISTNIPQIATSFSPNFYNFPQIATSFPQISTNFLHKFCPQFEVVQIFEGTIPPPTPFSYAYAYPLSVVCRNFTVSYPFHLLPVPSLK